MSTEAELVAFVGELFREIAVLSYMDYATLTVLLYDLGELHTVLGLLLLTSKQLSRLKRRLVYICRCGCVASLSCNSRLGTFG